MENCTHLAKMHTPPLNEGDSWCSNWRAAGFLFLRVVAVCRNTSPSGCVVSTSTSSFLQVMAHWLLTYPRCGSARVATISFGHHFSVEPKERASDRDTT